MEANTIGAATDFIHSRKHILKNMTTTEQIPTKQFEQQVYALDCLSQMAYWSKINIEYCKTAARNLPAGGLKDAVIFYHQQEENWLNKIIRGLKGHKANGVDIYSAMKEDLEDIPMVVMFDIISDLKKAQDMEGISEIVKELSTLKSISPILTNLQAIIRNQKNKENAG